MENQELSKKQIKRLARIERKEKEMAKINNSKRVKSVLVWSTTLLVIIVVVLGLVILVRNSSTEIGPLIASEEIRNDDWALGSPSAKIQMIEYSDFQCSACAQYESLIDQLLEEYEGDLYFAYRHFPLKSIHPYAQITAQASEAAGLQDKFWEMKSLLFENQRSWSNSPNIETILIGFAGDLGLDVEKFESDLSSEPVEDRVDANDSRAREIGLSYTPTFIVNGEIVSSPSSTDSFRLIFDAILEEGNGE